MPFVRAGPAEILRASQKDEDAIKSVQERLEKLFLYIADFQTVVKHKTSVQCLGSLLFYLNTTVYGLQTLGEEYTGIVQVDHSFRKLPSQFRTCLMVSLECLGPTLLAHILKTGEKRIREKRKAATTEAEKTELNVLGYTLKILPLFSHLQKALFFCRVGTYQLSKQIAGVHYILVRFWLKDRKSIRGFRLLGLVSMLQLLALLYQHTSDFINRPEQAHDAAIHSTVKNVESTKSCVICMEQLANPTATPCGHIFCWFCIAEWSQNEEKCPVCRELVPLHRLVPLRNYV